VIAKVSGQRALVQVMWKRTLWNFPSHMRSMTGKRILWRYFQNHRLDNFSS